MKTRSPVMWWHATWEPKEQWKSLLIIIPAYELGLKECTEIWMHPSLFLLAEYCHKMYFLFRVLARSHSMLLDFTWNTAWNNLSPFFNRPLFAVFLGSFESDLPLLASQNINIPLIFNCIFAKLDEITSTDAPITTVCWVLGCPHKTEKKP